TCLDLLLIEMVQVLRTSVAETSLASPHGGPPPRDGLDHPRNSGSAPGRSDEEQERATELLYYKVERVGFRIGQRLAERYTKDRPRFTDTLDIVKFICKDIWIKLFHKQVDNLKTNHRGVYILQDNKFRWLLRMSGSEGVANATQQAAPYLWFPCGVIRGILANLGVDSTVSVKETNLPQCAFQIKINRAV
ncbi:hypothetical protein H4R35_007581, partial [Dimargaris xerosporica]